MTDSKDTGKHEHNIRLDKKCDCGVTALELLQSQEAPPNPYGLGDVIELDEILLTFAKQLRSVDYSRVKKLITDKQEEIDRVGLHHSAKARILANFTPNSEVKQQVLIGQKEIIDLLRWKYKELNEQSVDIKFVEAYNIIEDELDHQIQLLKEGKE